MIFLLFLHSFIVQRFDVDVFRSGPEHTCFSCHTWDTKLLSLQTEPDLMWSLILGLMALPGVPHPVLWPILWPVHFHWNATLPERHPSVSFLISWLSIPKISQLITDPPWRVQAPDMGYLWVEVDIAAIGLLRHRTEMRNPHQTPSNRRNSGHQDKKQQSSSKQWLNLTSSLSRFCLPDVVQVVWILRWIIYFFFALVQEESEADCDRNI